MSASFLLRILCFVVCINAAAQEKTFARQEPPDDSTSKILNGPAADSSKLRAYYYACSKLYKEHKYKEQLEYSYRAIAFADSTKNLNNISLAKIRFLMCSVFNGQVTDVKEAFDQGLKVMVAADSLHDSLLKAKALQSMGLSQAYLIKDKFITALKYYTEALTIAKRIKNHALVIGILSLIGNTYIFTGDAADAINTYRDCIRIGHENNIENTAVGVALNNLGNIYDDQGKLDSALHYFRMAEIVDRHIADTIQLAVALQNIGNIILRNGNDYIKGLDTLLLAAKMGMRGNNPYYSSGITDDLYRLFKKHGDLKNALLWKEQSDSLQGLFQSAELQQKIIPYQIESSVEQWKQKEQLIQEKKDAVTREKIKRQRLVKNIVIAALIIAVLFAFYFLNRYRLIRDQKRLIESQKQQVDRAYKIVDEKNNDILASIRYASRIQNALLVPQENLDKLFSEYFILYLPRDIVSGDFYWIAQQDGKIYMATADCTGHGVPGAFMSLLGNSFLNEIVQVRKITRPDLVLNELRKMVTDTLNPKGSHEERKDGMDIVFCCFDFEHMQLSYAAANNPLWLIRRSAGNTFIETPYDKFPVGRFVELDTPFKYNTLKLEKGDTLYTFTDGYRDQFGGNKGKKLGRKRFRDYIEQIHDLPMKEQSERLFSYFNEWKGAANEQVDDICVVGIRI